MLAGVTQGSGVGIDEQTRTEKGRTLASGMYWLQPFVALVSLIVQREFA